MVDCLSFLWIFYDMVNPQGWSEGTDTIWLQKTQLRICCMQIIPFPRRHKLCDLFIEQGPRCETNVNDMLSLIKSQSLTNLVNEIPKASGMLSSNKRLHLSWSIGFAARVCPRQSHYRHLRDWGGQQVSTCVCLLGNSVLYCNEGRQGSSKIVTMINSCVITG